MACRALPVASSILLGLLGLLGLGASLAAGGCVAPFDGSNIQIDFAAAVQTATRDGQVPQPLQPPAHTHYELYAADQVFRLDPEGNPVLDEDGHPILEQTYLFAITSFEIRPVIDRGSPCFIELEDTRFPGLHVTQFEARVKEVIEAEYGTDDPFAPLLPSEASTDLLGAIRRNGNLALLEGALKAVTSHDPFRYPPAAAAGQCPPSSADAIPDPGCRDDDSNAQRLRVCRGWWADNPDYYEGSDKVFTLPLNGRFLGMVQGENPINGGRVGGSSMFVPVNLVGRDAYVLNWQYDDANGDGAPDFPPDLEPREESPVGYLYMAGTPREISRDVTTVPLRHPLAPSIKADLAIVPNLGHDDVHF
jgi:hypothetical protein